MSKNPYVSNNGLHVTNRSNQSVSIAWPSEFTVVPNEAKEDVNEEEDYCSEDVTRTPPIPVKDGNYYEIQMKKGDADISDSWDIIYRGYGGSYKVDDLPPDSVYSFRMKRKKEGEWGTNVVASTDPSPASTEDLSRAVEMSSEYLVSRILDLTSSKHLKQILHNRDRSGMTALMVACHTGNVDITKKLICSGSLVNAVSSGTFRTPLMFACIAGHISVVTLLGQYDVNWIARDKCGCSAVDYSINGGHTAIVKLLYSILKRGSINELDTFGWTPLMRATIVTDGLDMLRMMLNLGADVNGTDHKKRKSVLMAAILAKKPKFVKYLLYRGANPYFQNENGNSCLQVATGLQYREITEILKEHLIDHQAISPDSDSQKC